MNLHTKRKVSLLYLVKGQLIYLSNHGWQNHRKVCPDTLSGRLLQERLNQESILVEIVRPSIWQLRGSPGTRGLNSDHFHWGRTFKACFLGILRLQCMRWMIVHYNTVRWLEDFLGSSIIIIIAITCWPCFPSFMLHVYTRTIDCHS